VKPGYADSGGVVPALDDRRVALVVGVFQETLTSFLERFRPQAPLVVHFDCDAYAGTLYVLTQLDSLLQPGTILMFDEFTFALDEWRAFDSWLEAYSREVETIASAGPWHERMALTIVH